jgi:hypothetical protein
VHVLWILNEATVKRQTTYEDLRILKSVVKTQDFMLSLDVQSAFFHVPIHPKHRKFFSSQLALLLFVKKKFIELQPGGYFVCSRQVVEFRHAALPLGWTSSTRIWTSVMSVVTAALRRHDIRTLLYVDDLLIAYSSFEEASRARQIIEDTFLTADIVRAPLKGCFDTPTQTLTDHLGFSLQHLLHGQRSPTGSRKEVLCVASSSARAALRVSQESSSRRLRPPSVFLRDIHLLLASGPAGSLSSPRSLQRKSSTIQDLSSLKQGWVQR